MRHRESEIKAKLLDQYRPNEQDRQRYAEEWDSCLRAMSFLKCQTTTYASKCKLLQKSHTTLGVMCKRHYVNLPRCQMDGCDRLAVIDPAVNNGMICREHLFDYDNDRPTAQPWRTRSNFPMLSEV